jgi:hypothetical protein
MGEGGVSSSKTLNVTEIKCRVLVYTCLVKESGKNLCPRYLLSSISPVLQLRADGLSARAIAASQRMSRKSVAAVLEAADAAGLGWDDVKAGTDNEVYELVFQVVVSITVCSLCRTGNRSTKSWPV